MKLRPSWLVCWMACLGCQGLALPDGGGDPEKAAALQQQGQAALQAGQFDRAIGFFEKSLEADPSSVHSHLSLAAVLAEKGDDRAACDHLGKFLKAHPEHHQLRGHYAELLFRLDCLPEAKAEMTRFVADAQDRGDATIRQRIHGHSRLMEIAEVEDDTYASHLHRGIGLYLLGRERARLPDPQGQLPVEALLCKAAGALSVARSQQPGQARPCWYLFQVWQCLGQKQAGRRWLLRASEAAAWTDLTAAERRELELACRQADGAAIRR